MSNTEEYSTYIVPFDNEDGYPQTHRLNIHKSVFDFVWSYNAVSNMPILTIKSTNGKILAINQLTPYNNLQLQDIVTGEPFMTIYTANVSKSSISCFVGINRNWSKTMLKN